MNLSFPLELRGTRCPHHCKALEQTLWNNIYEEAHNRERDCMQQEGSSKLHIPCLGDRYI